VNRSPSARGRAGPPSACAECLARAWLLARLSGHLDTARKRIPEVLDLGDDDLIAAVAGKDRGAVDGERAGFDPDAYRARCADAAVEVICRCDSAYPRALWSLPAEPAVLHVCGGMTRLLGLLDGDTVAIVGARTASPYGLDMARGLGRGVGAARVTIISGMALGIDAAAHRGALDGGGATVAVLASAPERAYPAANRTLHRQIIAAGAVVSELGPGVAVRRWMFPARNRLIAALSSMTIVAAARQPSGAILTALQAMKLGRLLGAVPGQAKAPLSFGPHLLLRSGAHVIEEPGDVLVALFGAEAAREREAARGWAVAPELRPLLEAIADGFDVPEAIAAVGLEMDAGLARLAALEMAGHLRRGPGGRFSIVR
jgi:DNA processing protein